MNNMYKVDASVKLDIAKSNYIEAGIHENIELKEVRYGVSDKGNEFIAFKFEDENGAVLTQTEWKASGKTEEQTLSKTINQIKRLKQIALVFMTENEYVINADSFKGFAEATIKLLGNKFVGKKVRIKAVYSDTGYVTLPNYSKFTFIEPMTTPKEKSLIKILSMDKTTRPEPTAAPQVTNPFEVTAPTATPAVDDLPF